MGSIFNEKVVEKCNLWVCEQCTKVLFIEDLVNNCGLKKKKEKENAERKNVDAHTRNPNTYYVNSWKLNVSLTLPSFLAFFTTSKAPLTIVSTQRPYWSLLQRRFLHLDWWLSHFMVKARNKLVSTQRPYWLLLQNISS